MLIATTACMSIFWHHQAKWLVHWFFSTNICRKLIFIEFRAILSPKVVNVLCIRSTVTIAVNKHLLSLKWFVFEDVLFILKFMQHEGPMDCRLVYFRVCYIFQWCSLLLYINFNTSPSLIWWILHYKEIHFLACLMLCPCTDSHHLVSWITTTK